MRVEVNLQNILEYGLDVITGNSRADLLARAAEMEKEGYGLFVVIPDAEGGDTETPTERNAFEHFSDMPDPDGAVHLQEALDLRDQEYLKNPCSYEWGWDIHLRQQMFLCTIHHKHSKHAVDATSHAPCLEVDPY